MTRGQLRRQQRAFNCNGCRFGVTASKIASPLDNTSQSADAVKPYDLQSADASADIMAVFLAGNVFPRPCQSTGLLLGYVLVELL